MTELDPNASDHRVALTRSELVSTILHYVDLWTTYRPKDQVQDFAIRTWREWLKAWSVSDLEVALSMFVLLYSSGTSDQSISTGGQDHGPSSDPRGAAEHRHV